MSDIAIHERPIIFSSSMIRAILAGVKTQTRRAVKPQPPPGAKVWRQIHAAAGIDRFIVKRTSPHYEMSCPFGVVGQRLWARESFYIDHYVYESGPLPTERPEDIDPYCIYYRADGECCDQIPECACAEVGKPRWRSSIHMPRWASRITTSALRT